MCDDSAVKPTEDGTTQRAATARRPIRLISRYFNQTINQRQVGCYLSDGETRGWGRRRLVVYCLLSRAEIGSKVVEEEGVDEEEDAATAAGSCSKGAAAMRAVAGKNGGASGFSEFLRGATAGADEEAKVKAEADADEAAAVANERVDCSELTAAEIDRAVLGLAKLEGMHAEAGTWRLVGICATSMRMLGIAGSRGCDGGCDCG